MYFLCNLTLPPGDESATEPLFHLSKPGSQGSQRAWTEGGRMPSCPLHLSHQTHAALCTLKFGQVVAHLPHPTSCALSVRAHQSFYPTHTRTYGQPLSYIKVQRRDLKSNLEAKRSKASDGTGGTLTQGSWQIDPERATGVN